MSKPNRRRVGFSVRGVVANLAAGGYNPLERAAQIANNVIRRRLRGGRLHYCCGHYGDPGC